MIKFETLMVVDASTKDKHCYNVRKIFGGIMGRNDFCFCGSEQKQKKCHGDVYERSVVANLLRVYNHLDTEIKSVRDSLCTKGCTECCDGSFDVSVSEFFTILNYLKIESGRYGNLAREKISSDDYKDLRGFSACIFLDSTNGGCNIYEVRPLTCRKYGSFREETLMPCSKIFHSQTAQEGLIREHPAANFETNIKFFKSGGKRIFPVMHPLILWFANNLNPDGDLKTRRMRDEFLAAVGLPISEFVRVLTIEQSEMLTAANNF